MADKQQEKITYGPGETYYVYTHPAKTYYEAIEIHRLNPNLRTMSIPQSLEYEKIDGDGAYFPGEQYDWLMITNGANG